MVVSVPPKACWDVTTCEIHLRSVDVLDTHLSPCERPQKLPLKKKKKIFLECFLEHLSFWVISMESPLIFYTKIRKTKYMTELFSSLIE